MRHILLPSIFSLLIIAILSGCKTETITPDSNPKTITTIIAGQVLNESGKPISGVLITCYGKNTVTNQYGTFFIKDVAAPEERCLMKATKSGYFDGFRAEKPIAGGLTQMRITLVSNLPQGSFLSTTGGTVTAPGSTATVVFPVNGYVTENGGKKLLVITAPTDFFTNETFGLLTENNTNSLKVVSISDFNLLQTIPIRYPDYLVQSSDGSIIGTNEGSAVLFFNIKTAANVGPQSKFPINTIGIAPSNDRFVAHKDNSDLAIYAISNGQFVRTLPNTSGIKYYSPQYSKDGKKLVAAYIENNRLKLRMWNF
jgi:hypothetical protein